MSTNILTLLSPYSDKYEVLPNHIRGVSDPEEKIMFFHLCVSEAQERDSKYDLSVLKDGRNKVDRTPVLGKKSRSKV